MDIVSCVRFSCKLRHDYWCEVQRAVEVLNTLKQIRLFLCKGRKQKKAGCIYCTMYSPYHFDQGQHCFFIIH